ncbi:MAG: efflux RND transporter permease subunit [Sphaerochaeta sp.]
MYRFLTSFLKHPFIVLGSILLISIGFMFPLKTNTRIETDLDKYMPQSNPAFVYSNQAEDWFSINDGIIIAIENPNGIYQSETLEKVKDITKELQSIEGIDKNDVTSLYTADNISGSDWGLEVEAFYNKVPTTEDGLQALRKAVKNNDMVYKRIVSEDEKTTLIIATINDDSFSQDLYHQILKLVDNYEGPESIYVAGRPVVEGSLAALAPADMAKMVPIVILVIVIVLFLLMQSILATILTLLVVLFSVLWSFGLMSALNIPIYAVSTMLPVMLIAIGVADGIHLFNHLKQYKKEYINADKTTCLKEMIQGMWKPVIMTSVTTSIGFISLLSSQVYPIKYFGIFTAFGVLVAMCLSLILIPAGIMIFGIPKWKMDKVQENTEKENTFSKKFSVWLLKNSSITIFMTAIIIAVSLWGTSQVWIDSSFLSQFEKTSDITIADIYINDKFGGTSTMNVIFDSESEDAFKNPEVLKLMNDLQDDVESSLDVVGNSFSLTDYIKRMNMVMNADDEEFNTIPDSQDLIAQYLLLYEMSGDPEKLLQVVDYNYVKANMTFQLKSDSSVAIKSAMSIIENYKPEFDDLGITMNYAGSGYRALVFSDLILEGQIYSILISLVMVIILLSLMFKSLKIGLIGAVPNIITVCISFGIMGILKIPLSTTTALLTSIAIGIGIDYAIHFIERYKIYAEKTGNAEKALEMTISHSGRAILFNAIVVIAGFMVLLFSVFPPNRALGALVSLNMFTSFLGTLTIMALLLVKS